MLLGFLILTVVQWAPKPYSNYQGPYITWKPGLKATAAKKAALDASTVSLDD